MQFKLSHEFKLMYEVEGYRSMGTATLGNSDTNLLILFQAILRAESTTQFELNSLLLHYFDGSPKHKDV